jgi:hypothetical protein
MATVTVTHQKVTTGTVNSSVEVDLADWNDTHTVTGLENVDNTSDANKPVSTATQAALDLKAAKAITVTAGSGLTGGGDLSANRTVAVGAGTGITVNADDVALDTANTRNTDHASVTLSAGAGLTGGGDISASRSFAIDGSFGFRNRIINPSGKVWQRQNSTAAAITDGTYAFDRWYGLTQSNGITASQLTAVENTTPGMMRISQANASAQRFGLAQVIENLNCADLRGQGVVLSARVRMSASTTLRYAIIEWTGTADTVTKDFVLDWTNGTFTAGNFFTTTSTTITSTGSTALTANTLASISLAGTIGSSANNVAVMFWTDSTQAQNVTLDLGKVQLEIGNAATSIALRPYATELHLCRRYYQKSFAYATAPAQNLGVFTGALVNVAATASAGSISFRVYLLPQMLATPTLTTYNTSAADANWWDANGGASRAVVTTEIDKDSFRIVMNAVTTAGAQHFIQYQAVAEL